MVSLLNRLIWVLSIFIMMSLALIDFDYLFIGFVLALVFRFFLFSRENIESAVAEMTSSSPSFSENISPTKDSSFSSEGVPSLESLNPKDVTPFATHFEADTPLSTVAKTESWGLASEYLPNVPLKTEPSALSLWIHEFFSDRPLAKVGWILLFLGALFFLWLIFDIVGPVGKIIIGLAFWFFLIFCGVWLDRKGSKTESRVLFGIGIAVNYLTILAGRHLLGNVSSIAGSIPLFSDIFATIVLLLNTLFAVVIAIAYASSTLLAFAFITAYCIPFIVGSETSSILLLSLYTTLITLAIAGINFVFTTQQTQFHLTRWLSLISIIGMTCLFSLASLDASGGEYYAIGIGMFVSLTALFLLAYRTRESILPVLSGGTFLITTYMLIGLLLFCLFALSRWVLLIGWMALFSSVSFLMSLFGFWIGGFEHILLLLFLGMSIFILVGISTFLTASLLLPLVSVVWFWCFLLLGISSLASAVIFDPTVIIMTKLLALWLLLGGSFLSLRATNAIVYFMSIVLSGFILIYPDTFDVFPFFTILAYIFYTILSLLVPVFFFNRDDIAQKALVLASLPVSALIWVYMIYQSVGDGYLSGMATWGLYMIQAFVYLLYAIFIKSKIVSTAAISTLELPEKNILLILLAIPLSLFTFSLAFLFREIPGIMSLAWVIEASVLYMVAEKMHERRIFLFASFLFAIGIMKEFTLIWNITTGDWMSLGILLLMLVSVLSSLIILRHNTTNERTFYDILHIVSILCIGIGISHIIPSTGTGWSIFWPMLFIFILTLLYIRVSSSILRWFQVLLILSVWLFFLGKFDSLIKEFPFLFIQWGALGIFLAISFIVCKKDTLTDIASLTISLIGTLIISSLYVSDFFGTFAVSIYLTCIATTLLILGIRQDTPRLRTIGLYIGLYVLAKIFFYDIWYGNQGMITRVVALMITGGIMIYLSQLYAKYVSRSWSDELSFSNVFTKSKEASLEINPFRWEIATDLQNIDVSHISRAVFRSKAWEFTLKRVSVLRLAQRIIEVKGKNIFAARELQSVYEFVLKNLESTMPKRDLEELLTNIGIWIENWGTIELIKK